MKIAFILSMPGAASWDGRWSGEGRLFARIHTLPNTRAGKESGQRIIAGSPYYYTWSDGWTACIEARRVDALDARKLLQKSQGFCGYDWMIESILSHGKITKA